MTTSAWAPVWAPVRTVTVDGVPLAGVRSVPPPAPRPASVRPPDPEPGPASGGSATARTFVVAHGFTHDTSAPATRQVLAAFARHGVVLALDFRGHGRSGGRSTVGRDETLDLDAAVRLARTLSSGPVAVIGFSLGGAVALRQAAIGDDPPDAVVAVSAPSRWYIRHTGPMRRVHWLLEHPAGPLVGRALGVRIGQPWPQVPATPLELIDRIPPRPLLIVHGDADPYFGPDQAIALHQASGGGALWLEPGMGHAESATTARLCDRIAGWVSGAIPLAGPEADARPASAPDRVPPTGSC